MTTIQLTLRHDVIIGDFRPRVVCNFYSSLCMKYFALCSYHIPIKF